MDRHLTALAVLMRMGTVRTVRVSSARARGRAKDYPYWGVARYELRVNSRGQVTNVCTDAARSDRRSPTLASRDMQRIAQREDRIPLDRIGPLTESDAAAIIKALAKEGTRWHPEKATCEDGRRGSATSTVCGLPCA